jgi:hypothetical protein
MATALKLATFCDARTELVPMIHACPHPLIELCSSNFTKNVLALRMGYAFIRSYIVGVEEYTSTFPHSLVQCEPIGIDRSMRTAGPLYPR